MKLECPHCQTRYNVRSGLISNDRAITFSCKKCGLAVHIDRNKAKTQDAKLSTFKSEKYSSPSAPHQAKQSNAKDLRRTIVESINELPSMPQVVIKTQQLLASSNANNKTLTEVIETDPGITSKVLKTVNSAYYGISGKISNVNQAAMILGHKTLAEIVMLTGTENILTKKLPGYGYDSKDLWKHSLAVAIGAKIIASKSHANLSSEAYTAGLVHDIGKIILDKYILERKAYIDVFMEKKEKTFLDAELQFFGLNHADIAYDICRKWNFPETINLAIKFHHHPSISNDDELAYIIHIADYIATLSGIGYDNIDDIIYESEKGAMDFLKLKLEDISNIMLEVVESANRMS
jgi:putative nucleotidyltransferase with HDIG domain